MKTIELTKLRTLALVDRPMPTITAPGEVLLKVACIGICGSDVHYYTTGRIGSQIVQYPFTVGHELSATVVKTGPAVLYLPPGTRVAIDPATPCFTCDQCLKNRENTCRNLKFLGCPGQSPGCLCEYIVMPASSVFPIPNNVTLEQAMLSEPLSIGYYALKQSQPRPDSSIAVLGSGPIGLSSIASAKYLGLTEIYATDKIQSRLAAALKAGAIYASSPENRDIVSDILKLQPAGMDAVFECAGQQETVDQAIELLKPGGKLMLVGIPEFDRLSFAIDKARRKELTIINIRRQNHCVKPAIDMFASKAINLDFMLTHHFPIEKTQEAFELVAAYADGVIKAIIDM
ncbi:MAG: hypothetical protein A2Y12_02345 [Planctomycetes bacterium GWF2_42_9]|nr:MAG: hypothetical protein A2Y12_02345 [Planctomycetes bacterium GWF2_42_9]